MKFDEFHEKCLFEVFGIQKCNPILNIRGNFQYNDAKPTVQY